jgi:hypothetical protein
MCRCAERRAALGRSLKAIAAGNVDEARAQAGFVATTFAEDAAAMARGATRAASARLSAARGRLAAR